MVHDETRHKRLYIGSFHICGIHKFLETESIETESRLVLPRNLEEEESEMIVSAYSISIWEINMGTVPTKSSHHANNGFKHAES
jgi:hypothetical protein